MFSQTAADLGFWRRRMTSVAAHKIYSRMSMIPIAPHGLASPFHSIASIGRHGLLRGKCQGYVFARRRRWLSYILTGQGM